MLRKRYAKKNEISKREIKKYTPTKWITASAMGIVTLLYTSPKNSIRKIGVVFGCIEIAQPGYNYTELYYATNSIMDIFYYVSWILGIVFAFLLGRYVFLKHNYDDEKKKSSVNYLKKIGIILMVCIIITVTLVITLKLDIKAFYTNGIKQELHNNYLETDGVESLESMPKSIDTTYTN